MSERRSNKKVKGYAARVGAPGHSRHFDMLQNQTAIEIEREGTTEKIEQALFRLKAHKSKEKILRVPLQDMETAIHIARESNMNVTITNLTNTKRKNVKMSEAHAESSEKPNAE